ncbi:RNA-directed DNA polymerase, eukaryota [Tanacetum coccineum]
MMLTFCPLWTLQLIGTRQHIDAHILPFLDSSTHWDKALPRKVNNFMWRLKRDRLPHRLNLSSRGIVIPEISCPSCSRNVESNLDIFFECDIAKIIWRLIRAWCDNSIPTLFLWIIRGIVIIEQRVKVNQKARILELKRRNHKEHCSDNLYAVSIKEDTVYPCPKLHSSSTKERSIRRIQKKAIRHIQVQVMEYSGMYNRGAHAKLPQYAVLNTFNTAY